MSAVLETVAELRKAYDEKEAEAAALRQALEAVEWTATNVGQAYCPWCHTVAYDVRRHREDCPRQVALAADAGRVMLERVRTLERHLGIVTQALADKAITLDQTCKSLLEILGKER